MHWRNWCLIVGCVTLVAVTIAAIATSSISHWLLLLTAVTTVTLSMLAIYTRDMSRCRNATVIVAMSVCVPIVAYAHVCVLVAVYPGNILKTAARIHVIIRKSRMWLRYIRKYGQLFDLQEPYICELWTDINTMRVHLGERRPQLFVVPPAVTMLVAPEVRVATHLMMITMGYWTKHQFDGRLSIACNDTVDGYYAVEFLEPRTPVEVYAKKAAQLTVSREIDDVDLRSQTLIRIQARQEQRAIWIRRELPIDILPDVANIIVAYAVGWRVITVCECLGGTCVAWLTDNATLREFSVCGLMCLEQDLILIDTVREAHGFAFLLESNDWYNWLHCYPDTYREVERYRKEKAQNTIESARVLM